MSETNDQGQVKLTKKGLENDMEQGLTREEMAEKYGLPVSELRRAIDMAGLKGKRTRSKPKFVLVDDDESTDTPEETASEEETEVEETEETETEPVAEEETIGVTAEDETF